MDMFQEEETSRTWASNSFSSYWSQRISRAFWTGSFRMQQQRIASLGQEYSPLAHPPLLHSMCQDEGELDSAPEEPEVRSSPEPCSPGARHLLQASRPPATLSNELASATLSSHVSTGLASQPFHQDQRPPSSSHGREGNTTPQHSMPLHAASQRFGAYAPCRFRGPRPSPSVRRASPQAVAPCMDTSMSLNAVLEEDASAQAVSQESSGLHLYVPQFTRNCYLGYRHAPSSRRAATERTDPESAGASEPLASISRADGGSGGLSDRVPEQPAVSSERHHRVLVDLMPAVGALVLTPPRPTSDDFTSGVQDPAQIRQLTTPLLVASSPSEEAEASELATFCSHPLLSPAGKTGVTDSPAATFLTPTDSPASASRCWVNGSSPHPGVGDSTPITLHRVTVATAVLSQSDYPPLLPISQSLLCNGGSPPSASQGVTPASSPSYAAVLRSTGSAARPGSGRASTSPSGSATVGREPARFHLSSSTCDQAPPSGRVTRQSSRLSASLSGRDSPASSKQGRGSPASSQQGRASRSVKSGVNVAVRTAPVTRASAKGQGNSAPHA